jgi:hypothetical protein
MQVGWMTQTYANHSVCCGGVPSIWYSSVLVLIVMGMTVCPCGACTWEQLFRSEYSDARIRLELLGFLFWGTLESGIWSASLVSSCARARLGIKPQVKITARRYMSVRLFAIVLQLHHIQVTSFELCRHTRRYYWLIKHVCLCKLFNAAQLSWGTQTWAPGLMALSVGWMDEWPYAKEAMWYVTLIRSSTRNFIFILIEINKITATTTFFFTTLSKYKKKQKLIFGRTRGDSRGNVSINSPPGNTTESCIIVYTFNFRKHLCGRVCGWNVTHCHS